jgi:hypothetical protein
VPFGPFPSSPLKFRTARFPGSGFKIGAPDKRQNKPSLAMLRLSHTPGIPFAFLVCLNLREFRGPLLVPFRAGTHRALHAHHQFHGSSVQWALS